MGRLARQRDTPLTPLPVHDGGGLSIARRCSHDSPRRCVVALRPVANKKRVIVRPLRRDGRSWHRELRPLRHREARNYRPISV